MTDGGREVYRGMMMGGSWVKEGGEVIGEGGGGQGGIRRGCTC